jgi:O-antigen/teichoic acid export membrane protein
MTDEPQGLAARLQHRAARGSWWTFVNASVSLPIAFVANAVVARSLGVADFGSLAVLSVVLTWVVVLTDLGVGDATVRFAAMAQAQGDDRRVDVLLGRALGYRLVVQLPLLTVAIVVVLQQQPWGILAVALLSMVLPQLFGGATQTLTIESRTHVAAWFGLLANVLTQLAAVVAALAVSSAAAVWGARALAAALVLPFIVLVLSPARRRAVLRPLDPRHHDGEFRGFALRTWATGLLSLLVLSRSEVVLLGWWTGPGAAGIFALATGLAAYLVGPLAALVNPLVPAAAGLVAAAPERLAEAFDRTARVTGVAAGGVLAVGVAVLLPLVEPVFGDEYGPAAPFLPLATLATCAAVMATPGQVFLRSRGRADLVLRLTVLAALVDVVLAVALIPTLGTWGALIAFSATNLLLAATAQVAERRVQQRGALTAARDFAPLAAGALVLGLVVLMPLPSAWPLATLTGGVAALLGYAAALRLTRTGIASADGRVLVAACPAWLRPAARFGAALVTAGPPRETA